MKLNWFSPLPPRPTEIAHFTKRLLPALAGIAEIVLWTDQDEIDSAIERDFEVRRFDPRRMSWDALNRAEANLYNIGNDARYHAAIWEVSRRCPGVVVLHDTRLQHLFGGIFLHQRHAPEAYLRAMGDFYGADGLRAAQKYIDDMDRDAHILRLAVRYPLTELATQGALAAVVHTKNAYRDLSRRLPCVCAYAALPHPPRRAAPQRAPRADESVRRLIIFGYLGPNRRVEALLEALAGMPERDRFRLDIYGSLWDAARVRARCEEAGLNSIVKLHGYVAEEELEAALAQSDLAINLRFPTMGEASASQLRIWSHGLPSIVTAADWYATLPSEAVAHVRVEHETEDIRRRLRELLRDPARFAMMGEAGRRILEEEHSPARYADLIARLVALTPALRSRAAAFGMTRRAAHEIALWSDAEPDGAPRLAATKVAGELHEMFGGEDSPGAHDSTG